MITEEEPCLLDVEIQSLKAIFADELQVNRADENGSAVESLVLQMTPESSKGENVQFVRFEIILEIPSEYPQALPKITLRNVRGLSEEAQTRTKEDMMKRAAELSGTAMLFELIQVAKEQFTSENAPSIPCSICLFSFDSEDSFSRTPCFHFFHTRCLANHVQYTLAQTDTSKDKGPINETSEEDTQGVFCPVCRLPIPFKESDPEKFPVPKESLKDTTVEAVITPELRKMQEDMAELYSQQLAKGGIINLEEEKNKFFIEISNTPDLPALSSTLVSPSSAKQHQSASSTKDVQSGENSSDNIRKYYTSDSRNGQGRNAGRAQSSDRPYSKGQYRKPAWHTENSGKKPAEEKTDNWESTEPNEQNQDAESPRKGAPFKRYVKRDGQTQRPNNRMYEERYKKISDDQIGGLNDQEIRREKYEGSQDKKGRRRNPYYDKRGALNENYASQSKNLQDADESKPEKENESELNTQSSNPRPPYRGNMKKKYRRPRNTDTNIDNPDAGMRNQTSEGMNNNETLEGEDGIKSQDSNADSNKNSSKTSINDSHARNYKSSSNYRYDNRTHGRRFYKEKQLESDGKSENVEGQQKNNENDSVPNFSTENDVQNQLHDGEQFDDRFKRNNFRYRNNTYGKNRYRGRNYRTDYHERQFQDADNNDTRSNFEEYQRDDEKFDDGKCDTQEMPGKDLQCSEQESANSITQQSDNNYRESTHENRDSRNTNPKTNRRYQRNYQNISENDSYTRENSNEHSTAIQRPRYWNRQDNFRKQENSTQLTSFPHDGGIQESSVNDNTRRYEPGRGNFRNRGNGKQRYGNRPDFKSQQFIEPEAVQSDPAILAQSSSSNDQCSEIHEDFVGRKGNNSRTNRREMNNWKGRNSHQRYSFPQSSVNHMSQSNPQVAASSSRTDPSSLRPNIKPFTLMYNSSTQDAQSVICIPPPF